MAHLLFTFMVIVLSWNVRGVISSTLSLCSLLEESKCDIAVISEHKLSPISANYLDTIHSDYASFVRIEHSNDPQTNNVRSWSGRGGVAILVNRNLQFSVKEVSCLDSERVVGIQLSDTYNNLMYILGAYMPSDNDIDSYTHTINVVESLYHHYSAYGTVVIAGDMNASCLDSHCVSNVKSRIFTNFVKRKQFGIPMIDFDIQGESFTFVQEQTMIDYILVPTTSHLSVLRYNIYEEGSFSMTSDHLPILADIEFECSSHNLTYSALSLPAWHKASSDNIENYCVTLRQRLSFLDSYDIKTVGDLDAFCNVFAQILLECANETIPQSGYKPYKRPDWTRDVKEAHDAERAKRRIWLTEGRPRGMHHESYREYKRAKRAFRNALDLAHDKYIQDTFRDIDEAAECDLRLFWKLIHRQNPRVSRHYPEIIDRQGVVQNDPDGVAEAFADHFQNIYTPHDNSFDGNFYNQIEQEFDRIKAQVLPTDTLPGGLISRDDVVKALRQLKPRKAPGDDNVTNEHLKLGGDVVTELLLKLFRAIVEIGKIPSAWKRGLLVPIYKGGPKDKTSCNSYRPISLLPSMLKSFEYILKGRIELAIDREFPNSQQQGFQTSLGCLTASFNAQETILHNLENGSNVYSCFLDTTKAFDTVWRHGLLVKLHNLGVKGPLWSLINDSHTDTSSSVVVNYKQSRWFPVLQGVRQGGVTSTLLYLVFINDLVNELENTNLGFGVLDVTSNCPTLADDVMCIALAPRNLQSMLNVAYRYSKRWRFDFNADKSCILCFRARGNRLPQQLTWSLGETTVPCKESYNHLGIVINTKCNASDKIILACDKGRKSFFAISNMLKSLANPLTLSHLYTTVVRSSVLYGCELWNNMSQQDSRRLGTLQHFVCKNSLGLPTRTRSDMAESMFDLLP